MNRAVILGGTGVLGQAIAHRLLESGWRVEITGRNPAKMPSMLSEAGATFVTSDRRIENELNQVIGGGANLVVDAACYTEADARLILPSLKNVDSTVMLSSKAVYIDADGNHVNSDIPPVFGVPILESNPTMKPGNYDYQSREGYGSNKVAAEHALLDSGQPITVIRASKVHGAGANNPREWMFVKRVLDSRPAVFLEDLGRGGDHTTAAANTAALVETVAGLPGRRILNSADPDAPHGRQIASTIAQYMNHMWEEILIEPQEHPGLGAHPWNFTPRIVLDTSASLELGYRPVGSYAQTIGAEIDWLLRSFSNRHLAGDRYFDFFTNYGPEDAYLAARG